MLFCCFTYVDFDFQTPTEETNPKIKSEHLVLDDKSNREQLSNDAKVSATANADSEPKKKKSKSKKSSKEKVRKLGYLVIKIFNFF